jgi:hypothetical protein
MTEHDHDEDGENRRTIYIRSLALSNAITMLHDDDIPGVTVDNYLQHAKRMNDFLVEGTLMPSELSIPDDLSSWEGLVAPDQIPPLIPPTPRTDEEPS